MSACHADAATVDQPGPREVASGRRERAAPSFIAIDGSSTVYPISEAIAEKYHRERGGRVSIGVSGTRSGLEKLCRGEIAIGGASRPIEPAEEAACADAGIDVVELPVAYDGISVVVHPENRWVKDLTVAELSRLWSPNARARVARWSQLRPGWPDEEIRLFGPGVGSGTYDYFTAAIVGREHVSRGDFTSSEDDNVLVQGVASNRSALGFFGYAYYFANRTRLALVAIDDERDENGRGPVGASAATIADGTYNPLSRPLFIYVSRAALGRSDVDAFVRFYVEASPSVVGEVGYIPLTERAYQLVHARYARKRTGSVFADRDRRRGLNVEAILERD